MRRAYVILGLFWMLLLVAVPLLASSPDQKATAPAVPTMGVSVVMADGSSEIIPIEKKMSAVIPTPGARGVFGVQLEPYMAGRNVAVHVRAVKGEAWADAKGPSIQAARTRGTKALGTYVIGSTGDSIQLADLARFGLPSITLKVVNTDAGQRTGADDADACIICSNGLECCWTNLQGLLACRRACGGSVYQPEIQDKLNFKNK